MAIAPKPAPKSAMPVMTAAHGAPLPLTTPATMESAPSAAAPPMTTIVRGRRSMATASAPLNEPKPIAAMSKPRPGAPISNTLRARIGTITLKFIATPEITPMTNTQSAISGVRATNRTPSARLINTSATVRGRGVRGAGRSSSARIKRSASSTARKLAPFTAKQPATPITPISTPPIAGPITRAPLNIAEFIATARPTSSSGTISLKNDCRTGMSMALTTPRRTAMRISSGSVMSPVATSAACSSARTIRLTCVPMSARCLGSASASTPPKRPRTITGVNCAAATMPSHAGSFVSSVMYQACAIDCIQVPANETSCPNQKRR